ncbi:MAG: type II toxin-antitoxin system YafQ family toxin [Thermodesulfobacteriota bacterium]
MMKVSQTKQFSRDVKRMRKRGKNLEKLQEIVKLLIENIPLPPTYRDHPLMGPWQPSRDCHIEADWILIYTADKGSLRLERTGTHSDLFKK